MPQYFETVGYVFSVKYRTLKQKCFKTVSSKRCHLTPIYICTFGVGGRFKRKKKYVYPWLIHVYVWQKPTWYCKAIILQLKINNYALKLCVKTTLVSQVHRVQDFKKDGKKKKKRERERELECS